MFSPYFRYIMQSRNLCALVLVVYVSLASAQRTGGGGAGSGGGGGGGAGGGGGEGGLSNVLMNDPFAFRRLFHPLANQRFMSSMGFNPYYPNLATMGLLFDMEPSDAFLFSALTGMNPMRPRGRFRNQQPQVNPFLVALGIIDGPDGPDPTGQGGRGRRRGRGRGNRANRPPKARRGRQGAGATEAGPAGASEARGGQ